jgi:hypothetical protein
MTANSQKPQNTIDDPNFIINEINELIQVNLDKSWMAKEWKKMENGVSQSQVHPLVVIAYTAHQQIANFIRQDKFEMTSEICEIFELALRINHLKRNKIEGLNSRLSRLISNDYNSYRAASYELQIAGALYFRGHGIEFIEERNDKTPDILVVNQNGVCEIECKYKDPSGDQLDYLKSVENNINKARKQFSKRCPGIIFIELDKCHFDEFETERIRLKKGIHRVFDNCKSISAIFLTSKILIEDEKEYIYRHRIFGDQNPNARYHLPNWFETNFIDR